MSIPTSSPSAGPANAAEDRTTAGAVAAHRFVFPEAWKEAAGYAAAAVAALAVAAAAMHLGRADLRVPFYYGGDALMAQMFVQNVLDSGWVFDNNRLGAPGAQNLRDYPIPDVLHIAVIKLLGCACRDSAVVVNLYSLLTFPLIALAAYFSCRRLGLGRLAALIAAVLYACLPYHFFRLGGHLFLAAYYTAPLMIWVAMTICMDGRLSGCANAPGETANWRHHRWAAAVLVCLLTGLGGVYYAFFSCFLLLAAGMRAAVRGRRWAPLAAAMLLILCVVVALGAGLAPSLFHRARFGPNPDAAVRLPAEADIYGLSVSTMLLPVAGHRIALLRHVAEEFQTPPRQFPWEWTCTALGLLGSLGFIYLVGRLLCRGRGAAERGDDGLAFLTAALVALGMIGGLGCLLAFYVTPMIRCYNRVSVFIAFLALAGLFLLVQRLAVRFVVGPRSRAAYAAGLVALLVLGVFDQTSGAFIPNYAAVQTAYASDADFGRRMEAALPPGSMIYQMPYVPFPENPPVQNMGDYDLLRPFLHTRTLRFSYGAVRGREASRWQADLASRPLPDAARRLTLAGFRGVYIDRAGFADGGAAVEAALSRLLGAAPIVSRSGRQSFFNLTACAQQLDRRADDANADRRAEK
jgi:phosphoglycerol transferase